MQVCAAVSRVLGIQVQVCAAVSRVLGIIFRKTCSSSYYIMSTKHFKVILIPKDNVLIGKIT